MKGKISREVLFLAIFTTITVFTWIGLEVYQTISERKELKVLESQLKPLNPTLDTKVIENLKKRKVYSFEEVKTPEITPEEIEEMSPEEAKIEESEKEATSGAEI